MSIQSMIITFLEQSTLDACQINHEINNQYSYYRKKKQILWNICN